MYDYQEDINNNNFFKILKRSKLYVSVERNCWLVCVPQTSSLPGLKITQDILDVHVLQPSPYFQGEFVTANNKTVTIEDGVISIANDLREYRTAKILFEETFYTKESKSFRVLCIDTPLAGEVRANPASAVQLPSTRSLADITKFLHSYTINSIVLAKVHEQIEELGRTYVMVRGFEDHAVKKAKALSEKALEDLVCANPDFRYLYDDDHLNNELSLVVESYVVGALFPFIFPSLKFSFAVEDARIRDNLHEWRSRDLSKELGLKDDLVPHVAHITPHLQRMESCHTPLEKLWCVQEGLDAASFAVSISRSGDTLGADDTLPLLIAAVIESAPPNLHTTLYYIQNFVFAKIASSSLGYQLVNLQAAIQFVKGKEEEEGESNGSYNASVATASHDPVSTQPWQPVQSLADNYKQSNNNNNNNRYSTSYITDYRKNASTIMQSDEILAYLTKGAPDTPNFTPHRYTSSVRSASSTNLNEHLTTSPTSKNNNNNNDNNSNNNNNNISGSSSSRNVSINNNNGSSSNFNLVGSKSYSSFSTPSNEYRNSKSFSSPTNPLSNDGYQDWMGAAPPPKPSTSPPLGSRNSAAFRSAPTLAITPNKPSSSSYSLSSHSSSSLSSNQTHSPRKNFIQQPMQQAPQFHQQYKKPPSVIKLDNNIASEDGDGGGFFAQLRKLGDDGVSSSQFRR